MLDISNVIAAFSEEQVERITGLTKRRLRYWDETGFFKPSYVEDNPRLPYSRFYSFKDIVALRTLELLRVQNGVPLQQLRRVAERLSHLKDDLWVKTILYVANRKVVVINPETDKHEEVLSGQYVLPIELKKIMRDTSKNIEVMSKRRPDLIGRVARHRAICHNAWVVAGTRIPVGAIRRLHEDGFSVEQIIAEYPDLTPADVEAALNHEVAAAA
jgi:DNA-binding transcriptional MerR regulator